MLPNQQFTPEEILKMAWRRRWWLGLPAVLLSGVGLWYISRIPDLYESETVILIVPQRVPESYVRTTVTARIQDRLTSIQQQIFSRSRLERVILDNDLYPEARSWMPMEQVVMEMRADVDVFIERGDAFRVRYRHPNPVVAQKVTERLATLFIEENLKDREVLADQTSDFLGSQLEEARGRLVAMERRLEQYRRTYTGQLPDQVQSNLQAIGHNQAQLLQLEESLNRDLDRRLTIERQLADLQAPGADAASSPVGVMPNAPPEKPNALDAATAELRALEARYTANHPDVIAARRKLRELEQAAAREARASVTPASPEQPPAPPLRGAELLRVNRVRELQESLRSLNAEIKRKETEQAQLRGLISSYQAKVDSAPTRQTELTELTRDYETQRAAYTSLLAKREESNIAADLERRQVGEQFKVLDPARVPERPFYPKRLKMGGAAVAAGLASGGGLAALMEYLDRSFRTAADITRVLNLPVLATVPRMRKTRWWKRARAAATGGVSAVLAIGALVLAALGFA